MRLRSPASDCAPQLPAEPASCSCQRMLWRAQGCESQGGRLAATSTQAANRAPPGCTVPAGCTRGVCGSSRLPVRDCAMAAAAAAGRGGLPGPNGDSVGAARKVLQRAKLRSRLPDEELHDIVSDASSSSGKGSARAPRKRGAGLDASRSPPPGRSRGGDDIIESILRAATPGTASLEGSGSLGSTGGLTDSGSGDQPRSALRSTHPPAQPVWGTPVTRGRGAGAGMDATPSSVASRRTPGDDAIERAGDLPQLDSAGSTPTATLERQAGATASAV